MKKMTGLSEVAFAVVSILTLSLILAPGAYADNGGEGANRQITINATVDSRLVFELHHGETVVLSANPVDQTSATGESAFTVRTNAGSYSISAAFGTFEVGDTGYDLIDEGNFILKSAAPDSGEPTMGWVVPSEDTSILSGESGYTNGEITTVHYKLKVDFTVPMGAAETQITYTATASM